MLSRTQVPLIRVFISSPSDVAYERSIILETLDRLPYDPFLRGKIAFEIIAWDKPGAGTPFLATKEPQAAIDEGLPTPRDCDIVLVLLWKRMGTPLAFPKYKKLNGDPYWSGTEWEYLNAVEGYHAQGSPNILIFKRTEEPTINVNDKEALTQYQRVQTFFSQFRDESGAWLGGVNEYANNEQFRVALEGALRQIVKNLLDRYAAQAEAAPSAQAAAKRPEERPQVQVAPAPEIYPHSPFPGLRAFDIEDAPIFFGRSRETEKLIRRVGEQRFVAVVAASGSGKSSLVAAGLLPKLRDNALSDLGSKDWFVVRLRPGGAAGEQHPFETLFNVLQAAFPKSRPNAYMMRDAKRAFVQGLLEDPQTLGETIQAALNDAGAPDWAQVLFFIDQFEELFTVVKDEHVANFIRMLTYITTHERMRAIVTMRSDFYQHCVAIPEMAELLENGSFPLSVPTALALQQMIERPAERAALNLDAVLAEDIVRDTGSQAGSLALMAYALDELYKIAAERDDRCITQADYVRLGGVQGAISARAEQIYAALPIPEDEEALREATLRNVFYQLVTIGEREGAVVATRKRAPISVFVGLEQLLVNAFIQARLLVADSETVEIAHEALLNNWPRLRAWLNEAQEALAIIAAFTRDAHRWAELSKPENMLPPYEQLVFFNNALARLGKTQPDDLILREFTRPESERLALELFNLRLDHERRIEIGARLAVIGDPRPGLGNRRVSVGERELDVPAFDWVPLRVPEQAETVIDRYRFTMPDHFNSFYVARYLVTYAQFAAFLQDGFADPQWWEGLAEAAEQQPFFTPDRPRANYPCANISWYQAMAFGAWLTANTPAALRPPGTDGWQIRLPTEWEWQYMASNGEDRSFPWGEWDEYARANTSEIGIEVKRRVRRSARRTSEFQNSTGEEGTTSSKTGIQLVASGLYPAGASAAGVMDLAGNLWEWCLNDYKTFSVNREGHAPRAVRGGSFYNDPEYAMCHKRYFYYPANRFYSIGVRYILTPYTY